MAKIVITGSGGYIGVQLLQLMRGCGHHVIALSSSILKPIDTPSYSVMPFQLGKTIDYEIFEGVDAVIHLACACTSQQIDATAEQLDIEGSRQLLVAAREKNVGRFIFVSSQSASENATTSYGRSKWKIERLLDRPGEIIVRPGLVYGASDTGLYGLLCNLIKKLPLFPDTGLKNQVQPIHVDDLSRALLKLATTPLLSHKTYYLGADEGLSFKKFILLIAKSKFNKKIFFIKLPFTLVNMGCWVTKRLSFLPTISIDRVKGLQNLKPMQTRSSLRSLDFKLRDLNQALIAESDGRNQALVGEAKALFRYINHKNITTELKNRYANTILAADPAATVIVPRLLRKLPFFIRLYEPFGAGELKRRLKIATLLSETHATNTNTYFQLKPTSKLMILIKIAMLTCAELIYLPFRLALRE